METGKEFGYYSPTFVTSLADSSKHTFLHFLWLNLDQMLAECTKQARTALYLYFVTYELPALISPLLYKRGSEAVRLQSGDSCS